MDKRVLQTYAVWAKDNLEQQIEVSLKTLGINGDNNFRQAKRSGDYCIYDLQQLPWSNRDKLP